MTCPNPLSVENEKGTSFSVPCGKHYCEFCSQKKASILNARLHMEFFHQSSLNQQFQFWTLTYTDEELIDNPELNYHHIQKFLMRARRYKKKLDGSTKLIYYVVGEYSPSLRPHWHIIFFNLPLLPNIRYHNARAWLGDNYPDTLTKLWPHGKVDMGIENKGCINYATKYITDASKESHHDLKTYAHYSKIPGIGIPYFKNLCKEFVNILKTPDVPHLINIQRFIEYPHHIEKTSFPLNPYLRKVLSITYLEAGYPVPDFSELEAHSNYIANLQNPDLDFDINQQQQINRNLRYQHLKGERNFGKIYTKQSKDLL